MAFNQWKLLVQLRDSLSRLSNDKSFQNVFSKDVLQAIQRLPSSVAEHEFIKDFVRQSLIKFDSAEGQYTLPKIFKGISNKINVNVIGSPQKEPVKEDKPAWKNNNTISKSSILSRTHQVLSAVASAETEKILLDRIEQLSLHIKQYPESRNSVIRNGAVKLLLVIRKRVANRAVQDAIREAFAVLGYFDPVPCQGIRILSIDGGGIRGILVLEMLKKLEELTGKPVHEMFDFLCGVSTGAILSFSLGIHHRSLDEISEGYIAISKEVFQQSALWGTSSLVWSHSYYNTSLWEEKLKEHLGHASLISTSRDPSCPKLCAVSAIVNQTNLSAYIFRNYSLPWRVCSQYDGGSDHAVWEAARASAAAPTYLGEFKLGDLIHQDGGILVNNPTAIALHEAKLIWPNTPVQCIISFGTGRTVPNPSELAKKKQDTGSNTSWTNKFYKILDSATDTEAVHTMLNDLLPGSVYYRFNPYLTEMQSMVEIRDEKLDQMKRDVVMYLRRNEDKFHDAAKALSERKTVTQKTKDWLNLQREMYGV